MKEEAPDSYLSNPEKYCDSISTLIQNGSDEWQTLWQSAIKELFHNSELFQNPVNNINAINSLLKVIEKAFKERVYRLRVQAFECWQFLIVTIDTCDVSDKLLNVLLIPLCASNHSVFEVLRAKLRTWATLLDSNLILRPTIIKKGVPNLLKILYGPHALRQASEFDDLIEVCGRIYLSMLDKCVVSETIDILLASMERAIPVLSKNENTQNIADSIWTSALEHISKNNWPASQFNYLIKTFQNLISSNSAGANALINLFLTRLLELYGSFPVGYLKLNMAVFSRCLFHIPQDNILNLMKRLMKKYLDENLFFNEIISNWHTCVEEYKNDLFKYWMAAKTCFLTWEQNNEASDSTWVLLLPVKHLHSKWDAALLEQMRSCYEEILPVNNANSFIKTICDNLTEFISKFESPPVTFLNAATDLCKIILQCPKRTDCIRSVKQIILAIFGKIPSKEVLMSSSYKSFAPKFVATALFFLKEFEEDANELAPIIRMCSFAINGNKETSELPVVQLIKKYGFADDCGNDAILKPLNGASVISGAKTNVSNQMRTSFLSRLSSSVEKKKPNSDNALRIPSTPKSLRSNVEDNDVQFIAIKPKPKNSPMTEHQKEISKAKSYIPALYEDLSQSQQSQSESISLLSIKASAPIISGIEYFEENANSPPERSITRNDEVENNPTAKMITKIVTTSHANAAKESTVVPRKSLFKDKTNSEDKHNIYSSDSEKIDRIALVETVEILDDPKTEASSTKRRSTRFSVAGGADSVPSKRAKRLSENMTSTAAKAAASEVDSETSAQRKKRGRPSKGESVADDNDVQVVSVVEAESQNLFVSPSVARLDKLSAMSSPLDSLMNVKNLVTDMKTRRRSLKSKSNELPTRSPIATRKRKSLQTIEIVETKKSNNDAAANEELNSSLESLTTCPISSGGGVGRKIACESSKSNKRQASSKQDDVVVDDSSDLNNSVIIIEPNTQADIISIIDSDSPIPPEKVAEKKTLSAAKPPTPLEISDDSTFFEEAETLKNAPEANACSKKADADKNDQGVNNSGSSGAAKSRKSSLINESFPEKLVLEETLEENRSETIKKVAPPAENEAAEVVSNGSNNVLNESSVETNSSNQVVEKSPPKKGSSPVKNLHSPNGKAASSPEKGETATKSTSGPKKLNDKVGSTNGSPEVAAVNKKLLVDDIVEMYESNPTTNNVEPSPRSNTSPISNNTRTLKIMKMACDSQILSKPKNFAKMSKSPLSCGGSALSNLRTSTNQRTMKILMANSGSIEVHRSSPTNVIPTSTERLKYHPKECVSPGILKKPDPNGSFSSPKSAKFVNFAEQLTLTRTYDVDEENYYDSFSSDDPSNNNLINDDEATSQEVLYTPLLNCSDDVKGIIDRLSLSKAAVDLFHRMGIKTVGHLASISTLTAKSIPAGDNRLQRLRKALKDYDEWRTSFYESKGLRIPSARRRILCRSPESILEISSLIELLDEAESVDRSPTQVENLEIPSKPRLPTVVLDKLSEKNCPCLLNKDEIMHRLEEQSSPIKATNISSNKSRNSSIVVKFAFPRNEVDGDVITSPTKNSSAVTVVDKPASPSGDKTSAKVADKCAATGAPSSAESQLEKLSSNNSKSAAAASATKSCELSAVVFSEENGATSAELEDVTMSNAAAVEETEAVRVRKKDDAEAGEEEIRSSTAPLPTTAGANADYLVAELADECVERVVDANEEDTDLIYTATGLTPPQPCTRIEALAADVAKTQQSAVKRTVSGETNACSLRSPITSSASHLVPEATSSPEIVTVDIDEDDEGEIAVADKGGASDCENGSQKESSMPIFSPDVTSRTGNRFQTPVAATQSSPPCTISPSVIEPSTNQFEERTLFTIDETVAGRQRQSGAAVASGACVDGVFGQLLSVLAEPFLTERLRAAMIRDETSARVEYVESMRKNVRKLRELLAAELIDADTMRECGLAELIDEMGSLKQ